MPRMGRPRQSRKDLPTGLYFDPRAETYGYREPHGDRKRHKFGKVSREEAIKRYVRLAFRSGAATDGTVGELITRYVRDEIPRLLRLRDIKPITAEEYKRQAVKLTELFGEKKYAPTSAESLGLHVLRRADVVAYLRKYEGLRGAVLANRMVSLLSGVFENANNLGLSSFNPCKGAPRNVEEPRKNILPQATVDTLMAAAHPALRLMAQLSELTALRKVDLRALTLPQVRFDVLGNSEQFKSKASGGVISVTLSKTGRLMEFEITPAIQAVLEQAALLPGRSRSLYVFPTRKGTPYTESGMMSAWYRAKAKAGMKGVDAVFRDLRTTELNAVKRAGGDATAVAGHADERTTDRHYLNVPTRIKARR